MTSGLHIELEAGAAMNNETTSLVCLVILIHIIQRQHGPGLLEESLSQSQNGQAQAGGQFMFQSSSSTQDSSAESFDVPMKNTTQYWWKMTRQCNSQCQY